MRTLRWSVRLHKWLALVVGLQVLAWVGGGLLMTTLPIERVRGEHKVATQAPPPLAPEEVIGVAEAAGLAGIARLEGATLGHLLSEPVWRLEEEGGTVTVHAGSGEILSPLGEAAVVRVAAADYAGPGEIEGAALLADPPGEYGRPGPVWQVRFDDRDATTLYVDPGSGLVRARRSTTWRVFDVAWRLHVMDYDDGEDFNHPLVVTAAGAALIVVIAGFVLLFVRMRRSLIVWRAARR